MRSKEINQNQPYSSPQHTDTDAAWAAMSSLLDTELPQKKVSRRRIFVWWMLPLAASSILGLFLLNFYNNNTTKTPYVSPDFECVTNSFDLASKQDLSDVATPKTSKNSPIQCKFLTKERTKNLVYTINTVENSIISKTNNQTENYIIDDENNSNGINLTYTKEDKNSKSAENYPVTENLYSSISELQITPKNTDFGTTHVLQNITKSKSYTINLVAASNYSYLRNALGLGVGAEVNFLIAKNLNFGTSVNYNFFANKLEEQQFYLSKNMSLSNSSFNGSSAISSANLSTTNFFHQIACPAYFQYQFLDNLSLRLGLVPSFIFFKNKRHISQYSLDANMTKEDIASQIPNSSMSQVLQLDVLTQIQYQISHRTSIFCSFQKNITPNLLQLSNNVGFGIQYHLK